LFYAKSIDLSVITAATKREINLKHINPTCENGSNPNRLFSQSKISGISSVSTTKKMFVIVFMKFYLCIYFASNHELKHSEKLPAKGFKGV
jgi:hypothetical protein